MCKWIEKAVDKNRVYYNADLCGKKRIEADLAEVEGKCKARKIYDSEAVETFCNNILKVYFQKGFTKREMAGTIITMSADSRVAKAYGKKSRRKGYTEIDVVFNGKRFHPMRVTRKENWYDKFNRSYVTFPDGTKISI